MAVAIGDEVYVPRTLIGLNPNGISPFHRTVVREREGRSVRIDLPGGQLSGLIAVKKLTFSYGVFILRIGDFEEDNLLNPLAKSILNYAKMLLPGDSVKLVSVRTVREFVHFWGKCHGMCKQMILIGHGYREGFVFGKKNVRAARFRAMIEAPNPSEKEVISLACKTGYSGVGKVLSASPAVSHYVGPYQTVHGGVSSLFASTFLHERLLAHYSARVAIRHARDDLLGAASYRLWESGNLVNLNGK